VSPEPGRLELTLGWVAAAAGGRLAAGEPDRAVAGVLTNSREVQAGDLFVALKGPRFDGHDFVADVAARGAAGVLVDRAVGGPQRQPGGAATAGVIVVDDTLLGLQRLAHAIRAAAGTRVVAITGSAGKTTTKETIAAMLTARYRVVKNKGNLNNHIGLPLSLVQLRDRPDVAVMELGMNHKGEISTLVAIAEPDVRVWTNVGDAHIGFFASADAIADAKAEILERASGETVLVCNADDGRVMARISGFPGHVITFGLSAGATVRAEDVADLGAGGMRATVATPKGRAPLTTPLLGRGNLMNVLAAVGVALEFDVPLEHTIAVAANVRPAERRGAVHRLDSGVTVIDDSYNSSPAALLQALDMVGRETGARRKLAVLGEMLELGDRAIALHEECGRRAAAAGITRLFTVGGAPAEAMAEAAIAAGLPAGCVTYIPSSQEAADVLAAAVRGGDVVLVKGSRGTRTDIVADRLVSGRG
jgi:UDP-N-acetylmuramoyl-tripeptide--D-alanyl-D-alanine ligase